MTQKIAAGELQQQINEAEAEVAKLKVSDQKIVDLNKELLSLKQRQKDLESFGVHFGYEEYDQNAARIEEINRELKDYKKSLSEEPDDKAIDSLSEDAEVACQHIVDLEKELSDLKDRQKELSSQGIGFGYAEYDQNAACIKEITRELKEYQKALGETGSTAEQAASKMDSIIGKMSSSLLSGTAAALQNVKVGISAIAKGFSDLLKISWNAISAAGSFGAAAVKALARATMGVAKLLKKLNIVPKMFSALGKSFARLGRIVKSALIFSVIYRGLAMVREEMGLYLSVNEQFSTDLRRLRGVLLTAFQPIYDAVVPALTSFINVLSRAIATVTQFFSSLFGTTAKQAQANAKSLYEQAHATKEAGKAAEEAAGSLAAFDEINTTNTENKKSGAGAEADTGPLFDWEYEDKAFGSWGEMLSAFLDKLLNGIPKLRDVFKKFAD